MSYSYQDKLDKLTDSSVWVFTKQSTLFDTAFKSVKLFYEMPNKETTNLEEYFKENHASYGIDTDRHRVLVIAQLFGLLTKTPLYEKGSRYNKENPTQIFDLLNDYGAGSLEYNLLKTEQLLKIKIKAIIDTANNNKDFHVLPVIFSYKVLKNLKEQHNIHQVDIDLFYTYVMTCSSYSEVDNVVEFISKSNPKTEFVNDYKRKSRVLTLFQNNFNLFIINENSISINLKFDEYFNQNFIAKFDLDELNIQIRRDVDYTYFLTNYQGFDINLIDEPKKEDSGNKISKNKLKSKKVLTLDDGAIEDDDTDYVIKVDNIKELNINLKVSQNAYKVEPTITSGTISKRYSKNPIIGKIAIQKVNYLCENIREHVTFISSTTMKPYMEAHHLIPISYQEEMWSEYGVNVDCIENIVSLCPICHRAIHYAEDKYKINIIRNMYNLKIGGLKEIGVDLTLEELIELYK